VHVDVVWLKWLVVVDDFDVWYCLVVGEGQQRPLWRWALVGVLCCALRTRSSARYSIAILRRPIVREKCCC